MPLFVVEVTHRIYVLADDAGEAEGLAAGCLDLWAHDCEPDTQAHEPDPFDEDLDIVPLGSPGRTVGQILEADQRAAAIVRDFGPALED